MKWRAIIATGFGLLLPLPLLMALGGVLYPRIENEPGASRRVSPVLTLEQRRALPTFHHSCRKPQDCEPPLGCLVIDGSQTRCVASQCQTDLQCAQGEACQLLPTLGEGPLVRQCVLVGSAQEGEPCMGYPLNPRHGCAQGLHCQNGYCGRPCRVEEPTSCPEGFFCMGGPAGPSCAPSCEGLGCAEGLQCIRFDDGVSVCARLRGVDCQQTPCPEGQTCTTYYTPGHKERVTRKCTAPCDEERPSCPTGTACYYGECRRPCQRAESTGACGPEEECLFYPDGQRWFCGMKS